MTLPLALYSAARQRSAPQPRPESASPSSSQVRTPAFQAGNTGSNPVGDAIAPKARGRPQRDSVVAPRLRLGALDRITVGDADAPTGARSAPAGSAEFGRESRIPLGEGWSPRHAPHREILSSSQWRRSIRSSPRPSPFSGISAAIFPPQFHQGYDRSAHVCTRHVQLEVGTRPEAATADCSPQFHQGLSLYARTSSSKVQVDRCCRTRWR